MKSKNKSTALLVLCCLAFSAVVGCGKGEKNSRKSPYVIDSHLLATLSMKSCESGSRTDGSQIANLVQKFNDKVCEEKPWQGYLLTEEIVRKSIEVQLDSIPEPRRLDFASLLRNDLKKEVALEFFSDTKCDLNRTKYFFPRLSIVDEPVQIAGGGSVQGGYSLPVGNDIEETCPWGDDKSDSN